jgi:hypothetical protein
MKFMMKTGSEQRFPNTTTASNAIEAARILMRSRQGGVKLVHSVVWDLIRSAYLSTRGAGSEDVSEILNLLSDAKPMRVFMAQMRQPLAYRTGQDGAAQDGRRGNIEEMIDAQAKQGLVGRTTPSPNLGRTRHHSSGRAAKDGTTAANMGLTRMDMSSKEPGRT